MVSFNKTYKKVMEDVLASTVFGTAASGATGGQFPANNDKAYAPGDARMPSFLGAKKRKGKRKIPVQRRRLMEGFKKKINDRLGRCYELSGRYITDGMFIPNRENAILVHGKLVNPFGVGYAELDHAWIETGEEVFDPVMDKTIPKEVFYALFKPTIYKRYTREETRRMILKHEHWGPWHS